ncbi:Vacuolar ATPase assembly integral membrane protein, partial [Maudiozyma exigua]
MFEIRLNDNIKTALNKLCQEEKLSNNEDKDRITEEEISMYIGEGSIPMESLVSLYNLYWKDSSEASLKELMTPLDFKFKDKRKP